MLATLTESLLRKFSSTLTSLPLMVTLGLTVTGLPLISPTQTVTTPEQWKPPLLPLPPPPLAAAETTCPKRPTPTSAVTDRAIVRRFSIFFSPTPCWLRLCVLQHVR